MILAYQQVGTVKLYSARQELQQGNGMYMCTSNDKYFSLNCYFLIFIIFHFSPEGKKFRSRNELRTHFNQIGSTMNSEDFDFSVKGKGHHNKGKSPTKKNEAENSKENQVSKKSITPVSSKRNNSKANTTPIERPKRELRKRLHSKPEEDLVQEKEEEDIPEEIEDKEVSNVKLKVKVGYTATGAMIRPSTNGGRKKKRRFRNMHVKKNKIETKTLPKPSVSSTKRVSPITTVSATNNTIRDEYKESNSPRTRQTTQRNRKSKTNEPVAGPSGLQKVKRSPRRVLKRKGGTIPVGEGVNDSEEDDDEDLDYVCSLYPNKDASDIADPDIENGCPEMSEGVSDPLQINEEDVRAANSEASGTEGHQSFSERLESPNGVVDALLFTASGENYPDAHTVTVDKIVHHEDTEIIDDHMQVVVIGDSVDVHNYAKPHLQ